jgi:hypothetical protein
MLVLLAWLGFGGLQALNQSQLPLKGLVVTRVPLGVIIIYALMRTVCELLPTEC